MTTPSLAKHPALDQWIALARDGTVIVRSGKVEIGQRISSAITAIAAAELQVGADRIRLAPVVTGESPDEGMTSGSNSIEHSGEAVRLAAASAREHLLALAARALSAPAHALEVADGLVRVRGSNRTISYWELLPDGRFGIAVDTEARAAPAALDEPQMRALRARRAAELVCGTQRFMHDRVEPGMLHARVLRPPHANARLISIDEELLCALPGVQMVREGSFVAVAAHEEFAAVRTAARLLGAITWDRGDGIDGGDVFERLRTNPRVSLAVVDGTPVDGPLPSPLPAPVNAAASLEVLYERGYQMHAAIGPSAAMARMQGEVLEIWTHSQGVYPLRDSLAQALGLESAKLRIEHVPGAGCYGHNGADDVVLDAALIARAIPGRHVLVKWSREDEHAWEPYGSAMAIAMRGSIDADGRVCGWSHEAFSDTHVARPRPGAAGSGPSRLLAARWLAQPWPVQQPAPNRGTHSGIHRNADPYYAFGTRRIIKHLVRGLPHRTSALRTLGGFMNVFAIECFLDELAHAAGADPLALRQAHLTDPRADEVLARAVRAMGWPEGALRARGPHADRDGAGFGKGIAFARYKNCQAYVAVAVELRVDESARVRLERAVIAADAGRIIDADGLAAQMEGGFLQAASWTLHEVVRYDAHGISSRDWDSYPILRFDEVPRIEVELLDRRDCAPLGAGEAACGPAGAAIANAVFHARGIRARRLPLTPEALRAAALQ